MSPKLEHVNVGAPVRPQAGDWNAFVDAARAHEDRRNSNARSAKPDHLEVGAILVANDSGADILRFGVLGIDTTIIVPTDNENAFLERPALSGITPALATHARKFVIALEPIKDGKIGRAVATGVVPVVVAMLDETTTRAGILDGDASKLQENPTGAAEILYREAGDNTDVWAVVRLGQVEPGTILIALTASALQAGHDARWDYTAAEVELTAAGYQSVAGGWSGTATNTLELAHIAEPGSGSPWYVWGVDVHHSDYPSTFAPLPIGGGGTTGTHKVDQVVAATLRHNTDGDVVATFEAQGSHDGACST